MIKIKKTEAGFHVVNTGFNNEILSTSEVLKSRRSAFTNIIATMRLYKTLRLVTVMDDRGKKWKFEKKGLDIFSTLQK